MVDEGNLPATDIPAAGNVTIEKPVKGTRRLGTERSMTGKSKTAAPKSSVPLKFRKRTEQERLDIVAQVEADMVGGVMTLKDAVKKAGISDESYYQWKRATKAADAQRSAPPPATADSLDDLMALEQENLRLRKDLAQKLRAANAELRRKLGIA